MKSILNLTQLIPEKKKEKQKEEVNKKYKRKRKTKKNVGKYKKITIFI